MKHKNEARLQAEIAALATHAPRGAAIAMLLDGRVDEFLIWAAGEGSIAATGEPNNAPATSLLFQPLSLDVELRHRRPQLHGLDLAQHPELKRSILAIDRFLQSPVEVAVRSCGVETLDTMLLAARSPARRFQLGAGGPWPNWTSLSRERAALEDKGFNPYDEQETRLDLMVLALLMGKDGHASTLARRGWGPAGEYDAWDLSARIQQFADLPNDLFARATQIAEPRFKAAIAWSDAFADRSEQLSTWLDEHPPKADGESRALAIVAEGAAVSEVSLARATESGWPDLLDAMFRAGANPNGSSKHGVPILARIKAARMTSQLLQIWLDAGAHPARGGDDFPFGGGYQPSAIHSWVWEGNLALVKQAADRSLGAIDFVHKEGKRRFAPMLWLALAKGHEDIAFWLVTERGCKLTDLNLNGDPCKAAGLDLANKIDARLSQQSLGIAIPDPKTAPRTLGTRTDTL